MGKTREIGDLVSDNLFSTDISNDRVGLGSTLPTTKLDVNGIVTATSYFGSGIGLTATVDAPDATYGSESALLQITVTDGRITDVATHTLSTGASDIAEIVVLDNDVSVGTAGTINFGSNLSATPASAGIVTVSFSGTIDNSQLAGGISNDKLVNDSVTYGGVKLSLGSTDNTPAFDLSDATNYPYSSLTGISTDIVGDTTPQLGGNLDVNSNDITGTGNVNLSGIITATTFSGNLPTTDLTGTITNAQLAGSIENSKLSNSTVSYGGIQLSLGGSDATPAFDLSDATNYPYSSLTGISTDIVGDTTPQLGGNLDVNGFDITGNGNVNITGFISATSANILGDISITDKITHIGDTDTSIRFPSNDTFTIETAGSERVRIDSSGNVGIGTNNPDELLHLEGDTAEFKATNSNPISDTNGSEQIFKIGVEGQNNGLYGPAGSIIFRQDDISWSQSNTLSKGTRIEFCTQSSSLFTDNSETPRLIIDKDGRVAIGTDEAASNVELTVNGTGELARFRSSFPGETNSPFISLVGDIAKNLGRFDVSGNNQSVELAVSLGSAEVVRIDSNFNVGIGSTQPVSKVDVNGTVTATSFDGSGSNLSDIVTSITAGDNISINSSTGNVTITGLANTANVNSDIIDTGSLNVTGITTLAGNTNISGDITSNIVLINSNIGSDPGPDIKLRRNSSSPADNDYIGRIRFTGEKSDGVEVPYAQLTGKILDATSGTQDGRLELKLQKAGLEVNTVNFDSDNVRLVNGTGLIADGTVTASSFEVDGSPASLVITSNTTFYVTDNTLTERDGSVTKPWNSPTEAAEFLSQRRIKLGVTVTVSIGSGTYTFTSPIRLDHPQGSQIKYVGATPSGTKPRGTTLNGNSGGTAIRGYTTASESANNTELQGYYNTKWQFNSTTGIKVAPESTLILEDILIRGNNATGDPTSTDGIRVQNGREGGKGGCIVLKDVAIHNFANRGLALVSGGNGTLTDVTVTNCGGGIVANSGILLGDLTSIGGTPLLTISNCKSDGINILRNGTARIQNSVISNNGGNGININENGSCRANKSTISNNGKKGVAAQGSSTVQVRAGTVTNNKQNDLLALSNSYIDFRDVGGTSTANKTSPMLNTAGNAGAFIQN